MEPAKKMEDEKVHRIRITLCVSPKPPPRWGSSAQLGLWGGVVGRPAFVVPPRPRAWGYLPHVASGV